MKKYKKTNPVFTAEGYEICNAFPGRVLADSKRYVNPKMENELKIFKKKIAGRFKEREIAEDFSFPRFNTVLTTQETETQRVAQILASQQH